MGSLGSKIWISPARATLVGLLASALITSILYGFNWHSFYDTQRYFASVEAERTAADLEGIRPGLAMALHRAWTFSFADFRRDPERWWNEQLYNRSTPLYGHLLTILVVGFGTLRARLLPAEIEAFDVGRESFSDVADGQPVLG